MENREKKTRSRLGTLCKVLGTVYFAINVIAGIVAMAELGYGPVTILQLFNASLIPALLWAVGILLDRQKEDRETLAEIRALLGGAADGGEEEEDEDLGELEARLETALEDPSEDGEPEEPPTEEKEEE